MIAPLLRIAWIHLKRDRLALGLTFLLPIAFFSIFVGIFGSAGGDDALPEVAAVVADEDDSEASRRLVAAIVGEEAFRGPERGDEQAVVVASREEARRQVAEGDSDVGIVLPAGFGQAFEGWGSDQAPILLYADATANPVAHQVVRGLLQELAMTAAPDLVARSGIAMFEQYAGGLTEEQRSAVDGFLPDLAAGGAGSAAEGPQGGAAGLLAVEVEDVRRPDRTEGRRQRYAAFQAAGTGVLFLLFSMAGAASALLKEEQTGTLERLLDADVGMTRLLLNYWGFAALVGFAQLVVMFVWGWAVFGLDLWSPGHLAGFLVMAPITAAAAAAFGLLLGTACRTLPQLNGISTLVILVMSAIGGSMVPRFLLQRNPVLDKLGLLTFNAWAIDGFQKVFWYETGLASLWPQVSVLVLLTVGFLATARRFARRWETS